MLIDATHEKLDVLVAEDDPSSRDLIESLFEAEGWETPTLARDGQEALELFEAGDWDLLVSDLNMPRLGGEDLLVRALELKPDLTAVVTTGNGTVDTAVNLMKHGVFDFITKPFTIDEFLACMRKARERAVNLLEMRGISEVVDALLAALESKDRYTMGHAGRVATYAVDLGRRLGVEAKELKHLGYAAKLHDVGKIGVHEDILNKAGPLTADEFEIMKRHPVLSRDILQPVGFLGPCLPMVLHHHERIDGRGYPEGIAGDDIPFGARIIAVVDSFDAMHSDRAYRSALPVERILEIIEESSGTQLDADVAAVFLRDFEEIVAPIPSLVEA